MFILDNNTMELSEKVADRGFDSVEEAVTYAIRLMDSIQRHAQAGYTELVVRNPETRETRRVIAHGTGG